MPAQETVAGVRVQSTKNCGFFPSLEGVSEISPLRYTPESSSGGVTVGIFLLHLTAGYPRVSYSRAFGPPGLDILPIYHNQYIKAL